MNIGEYCPSQNIILHSQARATRYNAQDNIHQYSCNNPILLYFLIWVIIIKNNAEIFSSHLKVSKKKFQCHPVILRYCLVQIITILLDDYTLFGYLTNNNHTQKL